MSNLKPISATRMRKNVRILREQAPQLVDPARAREFGVDVVTAEQLRVVHDPKRLAGAGLTDRQMKALQSVKVESFSLKLDTGMFSGTVHVVDMAFRITGQNDTIFRFSASDIATVIEYLTLAVKPISQYASQYGPHSVNISPVALLAQVDVPTTEYNDGWLTNWVNTIAQNSSIPSTDCICILNHPVMVNTSAKLSDYVGGFHETADCPYMFINVAGTGLTLDDRAWIYANSLSHKLAEMIVDPHVHSGNPEVCDPCAGNCNNLFLNCFSRTGEYLGSVKNAAFTFPYDFFVAAVVQPDFASFCKNPPTPAIACGYWPEVWSALGGNDLRMITAATNTENNLELFGIDSHGAVYRLIQEQGGWGGWTSLLGHQLSQILALNNDDGRLEILTLGGDRMVYHIWQTPPNNDWGQWEGMGGKDIHGIIALMDAERRLVVFGFDRSGAISMSSQGGPNGQWGDWQPLEGHSLKQMAATVNSQKQLVLFALGGDGEVYFRLRDTTGVWGAWGGIPSANLSQITVANDSNGGLVLFGLGTDKKAWSCTQAAQSKVWGPWTTLNGSDLKSLVAAANDNGCLDLFSIGGNSRTYHITQQPPNNAWGDWEGLAATTKLEFQQLVPILKANRELEVFGLTSGTVFHISQTEKNGGWS